MVFSKESFVKIEKYLPVQRKKSIIDNYVFLSAILYTIENGCKWRAIPKEYGNWHTIYTRFSRWSKNGYLQRIFEALQKEGIISIEIKRACLDSTHIKVHPDAAGALKKSCKQSIGRSKGGLTIKIHVVALSDKTARAFSLSLGNVHDAPEVQKLLAMLNGKGVSLLMDQAYEGDKMCELAKK